MSKQSSSVLPKIRHVYLTWQRDPCSTITINIHGIHSPDELIVYYDTQPHDSKISQYPFAAYGRFDSTFRVSDERRLYHIELTQLQPGTTYFFTIADKYGAYEREMRFQTIPKIGKLTFVEGGDWEVTADAELLARRAAKISPQAALLGGDYPSDVFSRRDYKKWDLWLDMYERTMVTPEGNLIPMVLAIGNHEVIGGFDQSQDKAPFFFHYFAQGKQGKSYFSLPFGRNTILFVLDSGHANSHDGEQLRWLTHALMDARQIRVKMALYHVPLFPSIRFTDRGFIYRFIKGMARFWKFPHTEKLYSPKSVEGRKHWLPVFDHYGLTVAFEHHDQALKRTKLLKNGREHLSGTLFLGDGGWGPKVQYQTIQGYFHSYFAFLKGKVHFFWAISIEEDAIVYNAITPSGRVIDSFVQKI